MRPGFLKSAGGPIRNNLAGLNLDIVRARDMTVEEGDAFHKHCNRLTIVGLYVCAVTTSAGAIVPWFTDFLFFDVHSAFFHAMQYFRVSILVVALATVAVLRFVRLFMSHPYYVGLIVFSLIMAIGGWIVASVGGFSSSFAYAVYTTPMLSVMLFVPPWKRLAAALAILAAYFASLLYFAPDQATLSIVGTPITWSIASAFAAFAAGHAIYLMLRTNFLQRRKLNDLTENLQDRVAEQTAKIRQLTTAVIAVQEQERNRIAHDLHDELGQVLVRMGMEVQLLDRSVAVESERAGSFDWGIRTLRGLVDSLHDSLDRILGALKPILLENQGFDLAVTSMVNNLLEGSETKSEVLFEADTDFFTDTAKTALYRIVQEATTNIVKHAKARSMVVRFTQYDSRFELSISDDGVGFRKDQALGNNRLGLKSIGERVKLLNGELAIRSQPGRGTDVVIGLPPAVFRQGDES